MSDPQAPEPDPLAPETLAELPLFEEVDWDAVGGLIADCHSCDLAPGDPLFAPNTPNHTFYVILSGEVTVHLNEPDQPPLTRLGAGEVVGELSIIDGRGTSAHVLSSAHTRLLAIPEEILWVLVERSHAFARNLLHTLSGRLRHGNRLLAHSDAQRVRFERDAKVDPLTGLHNRRWLEEILERTVERHARDGHPLAVIMLDVDHFKAFNDRYGHLAGDCALRAVGETVASHLRGTDLAARYGGEELVLVLPETNLQQAVEVADRVRGSVSGTPINDTEGRPLPGLTLSAGIAALDPQRADPHALLSEADQALYRAKSAGRNQVRT